MGGCLRDTARPLFCAIWGRDACGGGASTWMCGGNRRESSGEGTRTSAGPNGLPCTRASRGTAGDRTLGGNGFRGSAKGVGEFHHPRGAGDGNRRSRIRYSERLCFIERSVEYHAIDSSDICCRAHLDGDCWTDLLSFGAAQPPKAPPAASKEVAPIGLAAESPEKIIAKMAKNYAAAGSYEDEGVVTIVFSGPMGKRTVKRPFSTKFVRPKLYRYEFTERFGDGGMTEAARHLE